MPGQHTEPAGHWLVVTDLDGTLLDHHNYAYDAALPAIRQLQALDIPVVFNTSKTWAESRELQERLGIQAPFVVENGACLYLPRSRFPQVPGPGDGERNGHWSLTLGLSSTEIRKRLAQLDTPPQACRWLSACSVQEAMALTGLGREQAARAVAREFSEPFVWQGSAAEFGTFRAQIAAQGLQLRQGGRFWHVLGPSDKGRALAVLCRLWPSPVRTIVLGDGPNDLDMLEQADISVLVTSPASARLDWPATIRTRQPAPAGWTEGVLAALEQTGLDRHKRIQGDDR